MTLLRRTFRLLQAVVIIGAIVWTGNAHGHGSSHLLQIKSIYVEPFTGIKGADLLHASVVKRLEKSGEFQVASDQANADAVLHGFGTLWIRGYNAINVRNPSGNSVPVYTGYLSVQLTSKDGEPLWSYLALPSNLGWKTIADDLASTVVKQLTAERDSLSAAQSASGAKIAAPTALSGAGATFPQPLYVAWFEMLRQNRNIAVTYSAVGSQEGMRLLADKKVDFAASEADPADDYELAQTAGQYLRVPSVLGGVVVIYNLPDLREDVHFTPEVLADIYLGKIKRWNDPQIKKWNGNLALPDAPILVVHRADGSGTTNAWSTFLARNSAEWKANAGSGLQIAWPTGIGVDGNQGVAKTVKQNQNAIGYVEQVYAIEGQIPYGAVRNQAGEFAHANLESLTIAANTAPDSTASIAGPLDSSDRRAYPITTLTWLLVPRQVDDAAKKSALAEMLRWTLTSGQKACAALGYSPLPKDLAQKQLQLVEQWK
jgi:phosphate ABC transporter phosphate-binding protein